MAMGITQALALQEGPIDTLAKLPQQQLISMAQQGRISAEMLPVILNEKAQMIQEAANRQAAAAGQQPSVTERNMMINAQAEAQPTMMAAAPSFEPQDTGIAGLNVPEDMYSGAEYAGGGIVAFQPGGAVFDPLEDVYGDDSEDLFLTADGSSSGDGFDAYYNRIKALREREAPQSPEVAAIKKYLADQSRRSEGRKLDAWTRALEAGLGMMGGTSPYAMVNIARGAAPAVKGYAEDVKEGRKEDLANMQMRLKLDEAERAEKLGAISAAEKGYGTQEQIRSRENIARLRRESMERIAKERVTDFQRKWNLYTEDAKRRNKTPDIREFNKLFPESRGGGYLSAVMKADPTGSPADWLRKAEQMDKFETLDEEQRQAALWALDPKNKDDPRAAAIRQDLGL